VVLIGFWEEEFETPTLSRRIQVTLQGVTTHSGGKHSADAAFCCEDAVSTGV
jgi:hypothetical protein